MARTVAKITPSLESVDAWCDDQIRGFEKKADHNKTEAQLCFVAVIAATLLTPLFVALGEGLFWSKIVPSVLSTVAAGSTAWLQLRRPQQLWAMYRTAQRELEDHRTRYKLRLLPYADEEDETKLRKFLGDQIARIAMNAHIQWLGVVPKLENLPSLEVTKKSTDSANA